MKRTRRKKKNYLPLGAVVCVLVAASFLWFSQQAAENKGDIAGNDALSGKPSVEPDTVKPQVPTEPQTPVIQNAFSHLYFYDNDLLSRYEAYQKANTTLTPDQVAWQVRADVDKEPYTQQIEVSDTEALPLLVNKHYILPADFVPTDLVDLPSGRKLKAVAKTAYDNLRAAAKKDGKTIQEVSTYRSLAKQEELYNRYAKRDGVAKADTYSARKGSSEHHTGLAIDLAAANGDMTGFGKTKEYTWIKENAHLYGFIVRYPKGEEHITGYQSEPWHITYVGEDVAKTMIEKKIATLEEYFVKYVWSTQDAKEVVGSGN